MCVCVWFLHVANTCCKPIRHLNIYNDKYLCWGRDSQFLACHFAWHVLFIHKHIHFNENTHTQWMRINHRHRSSYASYRTHIDTGQYPTRGFPTAYDGMLKLILCRIATFQFHHGTSAGILLNSKLIVFSIDLCPIMTSNINFLLAKIKLLIFPWLDTKPYSVTSLWVWTLVFFSRVACIRIESITKSQLLAIFLMEIHDN